MRSLPGNYQSIIGNPIQTHANKNAPSLNVWIFRHLVPLTEKIFLEEQDLNVSGASAIDIAVKHSRYGRQSESIHIAYILDGVINYKQSRFHNRMRDHLWTDENLDIEASDVSISFDGTMPKDYSGEVEFVTEREPWIFWVNSGSCYGKILHSNMEPVILANSGCTKVSATKGTDSDVGGFNFGLCVFMIINGQLFYRQLIDGVWYDAEAVTPLNSYTLTDIAACRTQDYRVIIQGLTNLNSIVELVSQYQGIAKQNTEHVHAQIEAVGEIYPLQFSNTYEKEHISSELIGQGTLSQLTYYETFENEHLEVSIDAIGERYTFGSTSISDASDISFEQHGDYGVKLYVTLDSFMNAESVSQTYSDWKIVDSKGRTFIPTSANLMSDGKTIELVNPMNGSLDFNVASGECVISYTGLNLKTENNEIIEEIDEFTFEPENLNPTGKRGHWESLSVGLSATGTWTDIHDL